jgi:hypothetical protein
MLKEIKKIPPAFPPHKVKIKATTLRSPSHALAYLDRELESGYIVVNKQREKSISLTLHCGDVVYERLKICFIKSLGCDFLWKD